MRGSFSYELEIFCVQQQSHFPVPWEKFLYTSTTSDSLTGWKDINETLPLAQVSQFAPLWGMLTLELPDRLEEVGMIDMRFVSRHASQVRVLELRVCHGWWGLNLRKWNGNAQVLDSSDREDISKKNSFYLGGMKSWLLWGMGLRSNMLY